ncbi:hypothetical protein B0H13DRAFT_1903878 [Mycena leptocephala]|nr:hypothetical protein B0H13DRAFT_1903878 [Mycena leptocephala]
MDSRLNGSEWGQFWGAVLKLTMYPAPANSGGIGAPRPRNDILGCTGKMMERYQKDNPQYDPQHGPFLSPARRCPRTTDEKKNGSSCNEDIVDASEVHNEPSIYSCISSMNSPRVCNGFPAYLDRPSGNPTRVTLASAAVSQSLIDAWGTQAVAGYAKVKIFEMVSASGNEPRTSNQSQNGPASRDVRNSREEYGKPGSYSEPSRCWT